MQPDNRSSNIAYAFAAALARPTVFVIDGDATARGAVQRLADANDWQPRFFDDAIEPLTLRSGTPACLLLDIDVVESDGLDLRELASRRRDMPVIVTASRHCIRTAVRAMKAGAVEFLTRPFDRPLLQDAIRDALQRSRAALAQQAQLRLLHDRFDLLSDRERDVMRLIVAGRLNKQAADELGIAEITVKTHRGRVMRKMRANSLPDLVIMAATLHEQGAAQNYAAIHTASR